MCLRLFFSNNMVHFLQLDQEASVLKKEPVLLINGVRLYVTRYTPGTGGRRRTPGTLH